MRFNQWRGPQTSRQQPSAHDTDGCGTDSRRDHQYRCRREGQWRSFCRAIGRVDWLNRAEYTTQSDRCDHRDLLMAEIDAVFREHPAAHWLAVLEAAGVPAGPIYGMDQVFADAQVQHLGIATSIHQKGRGDVRVIGQPVRLSRTPARITQGAAERGEHTMEILQAFGVPPDEIHRLHESGTI